jgi:mannose-1-phosphate guanylyltransferase
MVLAAGRGVRLAPRTDTRPKPLMPVGGRPLLEHILVFLRAGGITDVVINLHHLGHLIEQTIGDGTRFGLHVRYSWEEPILDTGGGIKRAEPLLAGEPFVVVNGDSLLELRLQDVIDFHRAQGGLATLAVRPDPEAEHYGLIELDGANRVRRVASCFRACTSSTRRSSVGWSRVGRSASCASPTRGSSPPTCRSTASSRAPGGSTLTPRRPSRLRMTRFVTRRFTTDRAIGHDLPAVQDG